MASSVRPLTVVARNVRWRAVRMDGLLVSLQPNAHSQLPLPFSGFVHLSEPLLSYSVWTQSGGGGGRERGMQCKRRGEQNASNREKRRRRRSSNDPQRAREASVVVGAESRLGREGGGRGRRHTWDTSTIYSHYCLSFLSSFAICKTSL